MTDRPCESCLAVLQDHGPENGNWGLAAIMTDLATGPFPVVYSGDDPGMVELMTMVARKMAQESGKPTRLVRFTQREDIFIVGGSS
jgi:hypothetical protein